MYVKLFELMPTRASELVRIVDLTPQWQTCRQLANMTNSYPYPYMEVENAQVLLFPEPVDGTLVAGGRTDG